MKIGLMTVEKRYRKYMNRRLFARPWEGKGFTVRLTWFSILRVVW